ncbi:hypothetical protein HX049_07835 [Myroides odoratimimus]|uniref:hypothetical protein n=1 Tax=Myroides odoratimimus TaxID=76832 RepID=UPI0025760892|nr:hypothetical protein [Myroides odoratimimus]MDM1397083.1 hypothetical protein [Myroides odoratimimus]
MSNDKITKALNTAQHNNEKIKEQEKELKNLKKQLKQYEMNYTSNSPKSDKQKILEYIFKYLTVILVIISLLLYIISYRFFKENSPEIYSTLTQVATAILSSGVFTAVLKSIQFTGIFKNELKDILTTSEFLNNRNDLPLLWREITKSLYKRKFPEISNSLEEHILSTYLPINADIYYDNYNVSILIDDIDEDFNITYTQTCSYQVIMDIDCKKTIIEVSSQISDDDDPQGSITNELLYFKIDGDDVDLKEDPSTIDDNKKTLYKIPLENSTPGVKYEIESQYKRTYPLKNENYKLFRMNYITSNMIVNIQFPEHVRVSFFNIGLKSDAFVPIGDNFKNHICKVLKNNIILPHQGFGLSFERIK